MAEDTVLVAPGETAVITLNRPEVHNALNSDVLRKLSHAHSALLADPTTRAIIVTGSGERAFSAGADLDEISTLTVDTAGDFIAHGQAVFRAIELSPVPVIAAVNGLALGGGFELVLACTFSVFSTSASVGLPESGLGLVPGYGGSQRLSRLAGSATALHVMLTGDRLDAERAHVAGVTPVRPVEPASLMDEAMLLAGKVCRKGPRGVAAVVQAVRGGESVAMDGALALEATLAAAATAGSEANEGIAAFLEKRRPEFPPRRVPHGAA